MLVLFSLKSLMLDVVFAVNVRKSEFSLQLRFGEGSKSPVATMYQP